MVIPDNRGAKARESEASIWKDFKGRAVPDGWAPYFQFKPAPHSWCGAHLLREWVGLAENGTWWAGQMRAFLLDWHEKPCPVAHPEETRNRCQAILAPADCEEPLPQRGSRGKPKNSVDRNCLNRLTEPREHCH